MRIPIIHYFSMNNRGALFLFFFVLLLSNLSLFTKYVSAEEAQQEAKEKKEKIFSVLQKGIGLLKYEIQRDQEIASHKMLIPALRRLRKTLKNDIEPKQQLINELQLMLSSELASDIRIFRKTLEQEKTIIQNKQTSKRIRRVTRNAFKGFIPIKGQILASFEKILKKK